MKFDILEEDNSIIKVIGVGGGGGNAINHMYRQGIKGVDFIICNTDAQALALSPIPNKIQLGPHLTEGRGAGSSPEVGRHAAIENIDQLKNLLSNTKMVFITAGMGGGTGTGASPIIAKAAHEMGILTVGIVTTPFSFEGKKRINQADEGLDELRKNVDTLLVVSNDKLRDIFGNLTLTNAFAEADNILTTAAKGIAEIITLPGYINVDFEDVKTVMKNSGAAVMGSCISSGEDRALKAVQGALSSPLLNDNEIEGARYILLNISSGKNEVLMDEVTIITDYIQEEAGLSADIIWGNCREDSWEDQLSVTIIATGFQTKKQKETIRVQNPERIVKTLEDLDVHEALERKDFKRNAESPTVKYPFDNSENSRLNSSPSWSPSRTNHEVLAKSEKPPRIDEKREVWDYEPKLLSSINSSNFIPKKQEIVSGQDRFSEKDRSNSQDRINEQDLFKKDEFDFSRDSFVIKPEILNQTVNPSNSIPTFIHDKVEKDKILNEEKKPLPQSTPNGNMSFQGSLFDFDIPKNKPLEKIETQKNEIETPNPNSLHDNQANSLLNSLEDPMKRTKDRIMRLKELSMKLKSPKGVEDLENEPAYVRKNLKLNSVPHSSSNDEISRLTLSERDGVTELRSNNTFLHDNVD